MKEMKRIITIIALIFTAWSAQAQQEIMISQYMFNSLVLNPAYAGSHPYWSGTILHRSQWVKFEGAPTTQTLCVDGPIANRKLGIGFNFSNDAIGIVKQQELGVNLAGKISTGRGTLAGGIRLSGAMYSTNTSVNNFQVWDTQDDLYMNNLKGKFVPKVGLGFYYYEKKWFAGLSVPTVYSADKSILPSNSAQNHFFKSHWFLNTGVVFNVNPAIAIKPSLLVKYQASAPVQVDVNCNVLFFNKFWLGAGYRSGAAIVAMAEYQINPQFRIGYAFDYTTTAIQTYSNGSHEVMLGYDFGKDVNIKARSPRYF
jgi:type IX secretion system PorP/SprF family membrane protein